MYIGLLEYADAWQQSAADRKVVDFTKKKLLEVDQLSRSKKLFVSISKRMERASRNGSTVVTVIVIFIS